MITYKDFLVIAEAHLINTDPHDDYDIEKTSKLGPDQTTFKHRKTGVHVSYTHVGKDHQGRDVHTVAWRHPESEHPDTKKKLTPQERFRIARHGIKAVKDVLHRAPEGSVLHNNPTQDETDKKSTENRRGSIYHRMGLGHAELNKETGEHDQYGLVGKKGKLSPLTAKGMKVTPESKPSAETDHKPGSIEDRKAAAEKAKAHDREMRRLDALERRRNR